MNYMELCQQVCSTLLSLDPQNEDGTVLMADIAFRKVCVKLLFLKTIRFC